VGLSSSSELFRDASAGLKDLSNPLRVSSPTALSVRRVRSALCLPRPALFRLQGLVSLLTVFSSPSLAGLVSCQLRSWGFPFRAFPSCGAVLLSEPWLPCRWVRPALVRRLVRPAGRRLRPRWLAEASLRLAGATLRSARCCLGPSVPSTSKRCSPLESVLPRRGVTLGGRADALLGFSPPELSPSLPWGLLPGPSPHALGKRSEERCLGSRVFPNREVGFP
jgi:hypothetical protein